MACQTAEMVEVASPPVHRRTSWVGFHAVFAAVAVAVLLIPVPALGLRVLALVVIYNVALPVFARRTDDDVLWVTWVVLAPMSVLMVLPDWFLSAVLGTLRFPDTGAPYIGTMPLFMAGMWAIALIPVMLLGTWVEQVRGPAAGFSAAAGSGLLLFMAAERLAPLLPLWGPVGVAEVAGVAVYVLLPELALCLASFELVRGARARPVALTIGMIIAIPFMYLGMLATGYQFLG